MKWQELLTTYWSQVTLVLVCFAYFGQLIFNLKYKKIEISYSLFQQSRIVALNNFYLNYAKVESMWHGLIIWDVLEYKVSATDMDKIIWPPINELKKSVFELKIYFRNEEHKYFEELLENLLLINGNLSKNYFDYSTENNIIHKTNDFSFFKDRIFKENKIIINQVSEIIRKSFKHRDY